jgi:hypothetical protein
VIDLGVGLKDAHAMGLLGEEATRQKAIPANIVSYLTDEEIALFTGTPRNAKVWEYVRFELNEIPAAERMPFVERKLAEAGVRPKVIPPDDYLGDYASESRDDDLEERIRDAFNSALDEVVEGLLEKYRDRYDLDDLRERIEARFEDRSRWSWRSVVRSRIEEQGAVLEREIENEVSRILTIEDE